MTGRLRVVRNVAAVVSVATVSAVVFASPALAGGGGSSPSDSAAQQYVEAVPTGGGSTPTGSGPSGPAKPVPVKRTVSAAVARDGGSDAPALLAVVSQPSLGAPQQASVRITKRPAQGHPLRIAVSMPKEASPVLAAFDTRHAVLPVLFIGSLLAVAFFSLIASGRQSRPKHFRTPPSAF